jgi:Uma2 family endonuclease
MSTVRNLSALTPEQYLEAERSAAVRHELVAGQLDEMIGASQIHNLIAVAFAAKLHAALRAPWRVYTADMKVRVDDDFYYPDLAVSREPVAADTYYLARPATVIEILSPTTEARDRLEKRIGYQRLASLSEYVLVAQERRSIEVFRRRVDAWEVETYGASETLRLASIAFATPVDDLYPDVDGTAPDG